MNPLKEKMLSQQDAVPISSHGAPGDAELSAFLPRTRAGAQVPSYEG